MEHVLTDTRHPEVMELTRRSLGRDIELAKRAQAQLFPRRLPELRTLSYAAVCMQAYEVGGDFYDFFLMGHQRMGFVVGDVIGKGLGAAMMMANLQGSLRTQSRIGRTDISELLGLCNQVCVENWLEEAYATLLLGDYDDLTARLRYVNCGHPPALLLHRDGSLEQLEPTAGVIGLFEDWGCSVTEKQLLPGDTLLVYSDGLLEACDSEGHEFGQARIADLLRRGEHLPVSQLLKSIVKELERFSQERQDDMTLVAARCGRWHE